MPRRALPPALTLLGTGEAPVPTRRRGPPAPKLLVPTLQPASVVLGLDLALTTGWSVINTLKLTASGEIELPRVAHVRESRPRLLLRRAEVLADTVCNLISDYKPDAVVYDYQESARPVWSGGSKGREQVVSTVLGALEMALVLAMQEMPIPLIAVPSGAARQAITGSAGATKERVRLSTMALLGIPITKASYDVLTPNMIDAACIALSAIQQSGTRVPD